MLEFKLYWNVLLLETRFFRPVIGSPFEGGIQNIFIEWQHYKISLSPAGSQQRSISSLATECFLAKKKIINIRFFTFWILCIFKYLIMFLSARGARKAMHWEDGKLILCRQSAKFFAAYWSSETGSSCSWCSERKSVLNVYSSLLRSSRQGDGKWPVSSQGDEFRHQCS